MEQVGIEEFRKRMGFWLENLPVQLTRNGRVFAELRPLTDAQTEEPPAQQVAEEPATDEKQNNIEALRAAIQTIETKPAAEVEEAEVRTYTEQTDAGEKTWTGTFADLVRKYGRKNAGIFWKQAQPIHRP